MVLASGMDNLWLLENPVKGNFLQILESADISASPPPFLVRFFYVAEEIWSIMNMITYLFQKKFNVGRVQGIERTACSYSEKKKLLELCHRPP
jgi:hypothetical protein